MSATAHHHHHLLHHNHNHRRSQLVAVVTAVVVTLLTAGPRPASADRLGIKCSDNGAFYCHDTDPSSFTRCIEHELYLFSCPEGLHFSTLSQTCDWPDNADCGKRGGVVGGNGPRHNLVMADDGEDSWDKKEKKHGTFPSLQ